MGIYIKGMEMPKDGVYWCEIGVADDIAMITIHGENRQSFPLVPVPPHGRLIDADALISECKDEKGSYYGHESAVIGEAVESAPTVIEAEENNATP